MKLCVDALDIGNNFCVSKYNISMLQDQDRV